MQAECLLLIECLAASDHITTPLLFTENYVVGGTDEDYAVKAHTFERIRTGAVLDRDPCGLYGTVTEKGIKKGAAHACEPSSSLILHQSGIRPFRGNFCRRSAR